MRRLGLDVVVVGFAILALAGAAGAVTLDSVGDTYTVNLGGNIDGRNVAGLGATALVEVESIGRYSMVLNIDLTNTSNVVWETARVSAFGFDTGSNLSSASLNSSAFGNVNLDGRFPNGFGGLDLCVINNRNNCTGGGGGGLAKGETTTMRLALTFRSPIRGGVEFDNFGVRYQSLTSASLGFRGASGTGSPGSPNNPIPEPRSVAMFLLGGLIVAVLARKQVLTTRS